MSLRYHIPAQVHPIAASPRALFTTPQDGKIAIDAALLSLWWQANGRDLAEIARDFRAYDATPLTVRAALACLAEANVLLRDDETRARAAASRVAGEPVSAIVVTHNSMNWLPACLDSLIAQTYSSLEIIVVDNASSDGSAAWVATHIPPTKLLRLTERQSLAHAINRGIATATGAYFCILNPDVRLESDAVARLVEAARGDLTCAAVAAKLKFTWAPAFLNGLGNHVGAFSWGTDNGLGHLDLSQFDGWRDVPSACFAAALIPRAAWEQVGALDESFPLYYEDNEWCYRARLLGRTVRAAPQAIVYHAFSGRVPAGDEPGLSAEKLRHVAYGRLRFAIKLLDPLFLARFLFAYGIEDCFGFLFAVLRLDVRWAHAYLCAWRDVARSLPALLRDRAAIQARRARSDHALFDSQKEIPAPLIWRGLPELTWDLVRHHYLPLILAGRTRALPEFADVDLQEAKNQIAGQSPVLRAHAIWRTEGWCVLLHRVGRYIQWRLGLI